ncbi:Phenol 2-monooxygenase [Tolypocladium capitatum]|uniref:Phenol 2-monooxygenase n=1 Tax=Tolypocladium capitatum TaxID=45235 RepID=A0A2K3QLL7_9HYPO|nr:Phenol 2-monooxygenase [Tolypocladium capitatum]
MAPSSSRGAVQAGRFAVVHGPSTLIGDASMQVLTDGSLLRGSAKEPTRTGRADGIQPRSLDLIRNMGLKADVMAHKSVRVCEVAFWDPSQSARALPGQAPGPVAQASSNARYPFTTLLHQGHIERVFTSSLEKR